MGLITEKQMQEITAQLGEKDKKFAPVIKNSDLCPLGQKRSTRSHYQVLVSSVLSQQLAIKAAATIKGRVEILAGGKISPETIGTLSSDQLRSAGASGAKARTILELTDATLSGAIPFHKFGRMSNEEITTELSALWGIGRWTVEMFLMHQMNRLDVWPVGDLGVRRGWELLHRLPEEIAPEALDKLGKKFDGFHSVVAWYCWRAIDLDREAKKNAS
jgi:DNA-3-methyladenine glycosylase II